MWRGMPLHRGVTGRAEMLAVTPSAACGVNRMVPRCRGHAWLAAHVPGWVATRLEGPAVGCGEKGKNEKSASLAPCGEGLRWDCGDGVGGVGKSEVQSVGLVGGRWDGAVGRTGKGAAK